VTTHRREPALEDTDPGDFLRDDRVNEILQRPTASHPLPQGTPLELSRALQTRLAEVRGVEGGLGAKTPQELTARIKMNVEAIHVELAELLHETPWKEWKTYQDDEWYSPERLAALKEEVIDIHMFLNNIYLALGMDDQDVQAWYAKKHEKNMARQEDGGAYR
jgi:hypothetical protein